VTATALDLSRATYREPFEANADALSSATFERVVLDGERYVVKRMSYDTDWVMRLVSDTGVPRVVRMHAAGLFGRLPDCLDTALVDAAYDPATGRAELLMRDAGEVFVAMNEPFTAAQHATFLDAMARLHAATWNLPDEVGLTPPAVRWSMMRRGFAADEVRRGHEGGMAAELEPAWDLLAEAAPETYRVLVAVTGDPAPLVAALATTPACLVHGDWKGGNLGVHDDGRVLLVDWAFPGIDAPCADLGWYLAVNCDRLPESKEDAIERYKEALERTGTGTGGWWDRQLPLALLGAAAQLGWSKAGQPEELAWWSARVAEASALL
jgi:hypothetical protein